MKLRSMITLLVCAGMSVLIGTTARADGMLIPGPWPPPRPIKEIEPMFHIKYHKVEVQINDQAAKTSVDQTFKSESGREMEATYLFPLPEKAAITEFSMRVGGEKVAGRVLDKEEARTIYESIVRHRKDPALLEYVGRGMFRASVFPIPAHGEKRIELAYHELTRESGEQTYKYVYPLSTEKLSTQPIDSVSVHVHIKAASPLINIYSPSHPISVHRHGDREAEVSFETTHDRPNRDFELFYSVSRDDVGLTLLTDYSKEDGGFFLLLASPRVETDDKKAVPKDVVFVFDRTGSMSGGKIDQAREALKICLRGLNPKDRFNVIPFNEAPDPVFDSLENANSENIEKAVERVAATEALGGTNIDEALRTALKLVTKSERPAYVLFLTDGLPTVGVTDVESILKTARDLRRKNLRLFVFGVGYDVNTSLLDKLSDENRGASEYVKPEEDIEVKVSGLFRMISNPALTDVSIDFGKMGAYDIVPMQYPDLFRGHQLVVAGRFRHTGRTTVSLKGEAGREREFSIEQDVPKDNGNTFIAPIWAARRIGVLIEQIRLHGENKELISEIVRLSKRYGIITEYTSFLVEEPESRIAAAPADAEKHAYKRMAEASKDAAGSWAVNQSVNAGALQNTTAAPAMVQSYFDKKGDTVKISNVQNINGLAFFNDNGVWTDGRYKKGDRIIKIKPFSEAHLALLRDRPELGQYFSQGEQVLVMVNGTAVQVDPKGVEKLDDSQMKQLKN